MRHNERMPKADAYSALDDIAAELYALPPGEYVALGAARQAASVLHA